MTGTSGDRVPEPSEDGEVDVEFDVIVVGSGAAGMTAALAAADAGASVVVVEKAACFGGSTARSGGGIWIPNNEVLAAAGVRDTPEQARAYLDAIVGQTAPEPLRARYIERGAEVLSFLRRHTPLRLRWVRDYADYYPEAPGGRLGGRSVEPKAFNGKLLGDELANLEPAYSAAPLGIPLNQTDYRWLSLLARHPRGMLQLLSLGLRWLAGLATGRKQLVMGQAIAAALRAGLQRAGVPVWLNTPLVGLVTDGDRVVGARVRHGDVERNLTARQGVVLAAGGFERNERMRQTYQRQPINAEWTVGAKANTGDAIQFGMDLGAATDLLEDAWWGPSIPLPGGPWFALAERSRPGSIMVNERGRRFVNESAPYIDAVHAMYGGRYGQGDGPGENIPCWLIFDQRYRNRYMFTGLPPRQKLPGRWFKHGVVVQARALDELADRIEVPAEELTATVRRFNDMARRGVDDDFRRGESGYDHYYGDPRQRPNPSLGALEVAPYYAVRMVPGDLGTKGGLVTDADGRVLREDGTTIDGLYAAGNTSAAMMGHTYPGPGGTIGPAMVFGYLAARHAVTRPAARSRSGETEEPVPGS